MEDDDFLLDDEEGEDISFSPEAGDEDDEYDGEIEDEGNSKVDASSYGGRLTENEIKMIDFYTGITKSEDIEEALSFVIRANPAHTSTVTVGHVLADIVHKQGHARFRATKYQLGPLRADDVQAMMDGESDDIDLEMNQKLREELQDLVDGYVKYLSSRDLSQDSITSRRKKQRYLPAFIIFMFSSGIYDFIISCPSMPPEYQSQIDLALKNIDKEKYKILEDLIQAYRDAGREKVADRVKEKGLSWFAREPAEAKGVAEYSDLGLTEDDINIYRKYRSRYTNITTAITQDVMADHIEVVVDQKKGIYEKLKDRTRQEALDNTKKEFRKWAAENRPESSELVNKLLFKNI